MIAAPRSRSSFDAGAEDVGDRAERLHRLGPDRAVIGCGRAAFSSGKRSACASQSKLPPSTMSAADRGAVAADILGGRIDDDRRAMLERPARCTGAAVLSMISGTPSERPMSATSRDREDVQLRIGQGLGVVGAGLGVGGAAEILRDRRDRRSAPRCPIASACWRTGSRCRHRDRSSSTMLSPACAMFWIAKAEAAWPGRHRQRRDAALERGDAAPQARRSSDS